MGDTLDLLVLGDLHYVGPGGVDPIPPQRRGRLALELAVRAVRNETRADPPDAIVLLGDLVDRGTAPGAEADLAALRDALRQFELPVLAVPGNHDESADLVERTFDCPPGLHELGSCAVVTFADRYEAGDVCIRPAGQMRALNAAAATGRPIVVVQHNPLLPPIDSDYPYNLGDAERIADAYADAGVALSLSGHYHAGLPPLVRGGVTFVTCPALCESPFAYTRVRLAGRRVESIRTRRLRLPEWPGLFDAHVHTEFAYCAEDVTADGAIERFEAFGLASSGLCEHADQLYFPREDFWRRPDAHDQAAVRRAVAAGHARHEEFRRRVLSRRSERVLVALETDPRTDGLGLAALPEDLAGYDYLIGSVHHLARGRDRELGDSEMARLFMQRTGQVLAGGVDILAHPFRMFRRLDRAVPRELFPPVVELLADAGAAAEINYHHNQPDPEFFALCMARGVRLSLGSDAHALADVADLHPHIELLEAIGATGRLEEVLWRPVRRRD